MMETKAPFGGTKAERVSPLETELVYAPRFSLDTFFLVKEIFSTILSQGS